MAMANKALTQQEDQPGLARTWRVGDCEAGANGKVIHLETYGMVKVFRIISKESTAEPWATNNQEMDGMGRLKLAEASWKNEEYNRGPEAGHE